MNVVRLQEESYIAGIVVQGKQLGRTIGFPTANIEVSTAANYENGAYGVYVYYHGKRYQGVMNIGERPTFDDGIHRTYEVHILDFNDNLYGEELTVEVMFYIRSEKKFDSLQALIQQLHADVFYTRKQLHPLI